MTDTIKLGQLINKRRAAERDAVHIAIAPVEAGEQLERAEPVVLRNGKAVSAIRPNGLDSLGSLDAIGVVDPFLGYVKAIHLLPAVCFAA